MEIDEYETNPTVDVVDADADQYLAAYYAEKMQKVRSTPRAWNGSPIEVSRAKTGAVCSWVYRWGFTSSAMIEKIGQSKRVGLAARLVTNGLLKKTPVPRGGYKAGEVSFIFTLTETGVQVAQDVEEAAWPYQLDPHKRSLKNLRHELVCQNYTLGMFISSLSDDRFLVIPDTMSSKKSDKTKQPDCLVTRPSNKYPDFRVAVEVELTKKTGRDLDDFMLKVYEALKLVPDKDDLERKTSQFKQIEIDKVSGGGESDCFSPPSDAAGWNEKTQTYDGEWNWKRLPAPETTYRGTAWDAVVIVTDIKTLERDYRALMQEGAVIKAWKRVNLKWVENPSKNLKVTKEMSQLFAKTIFFQPITAQLK